MLGVLLGALINLNGRQDYVHWGVIEITVANAVIIALMVVVFVAAIALPFPQHRRTRGSR